MNTEKQVAPPVTWIGWFGGKYRWLSNFYPVEVTFDHVKFPTVEHAYQAAKTPHPGMYRRIQLAKTPAIAKKIGRQCSLPPHWETTKEVVMLFLLRQKFEQPKFKSLLLATGNADLVEGNTWGDIYWGVCRGVGKNRLGLLLMQVRTEIRQAQT